MRIKRTKRREKGVRRKDTHRFVNLPSYGFNAFSIAEICVCCCYFFIHGDDEK